MACIRIGREFEIHKCLPYSAVCTATQCLHGDCIGGNCRCHSGWEGPTCEEGNLHSPQAERPKLILLIWFMKNTDEYVSCSLPCPFTKTRMFPHVMAITIISQKSAQYTVHLIMSTLG